MIGAKARLSLNRDVGPKKYEEKTHNRHRTARWARHCGLALRVRVIHAIACSL